MSKRHRSPAGSERVPKRERRWDTHRERQAVRASLVATADPEEVLVPVLNHDRPRVAVEPKARRRPRHWKLKEWKRRTSRRRERALMLERLAKTP